MRRWAHLTKLASSTPLAARNGASPKAAAGGAVEPGVAQNDEIIGARLQAQGTGICKTCISVDPDSMQPSTILDVVYKNF